MTKPYKCRVEYLQSTGTQYIDTGVYPTQLTEVEYRCAVTGSVSNVDSHLFGSRLSASSEAFDLAYMNTQPNGTEKFRFIHGTTTTQETTTSVTASQLANPHTYYMSGTSFKVDGSEKMSFTTSSFTGTYSLWLFGVNSAGSLHNQVRAQRVYKCKIWNNDTIVRDFIPVLDNNGRPAMYDNVSGQLFYNLGSGEFTYGRKIIPVEYLESTGTQYIDTEIKGKNNLQYKTKINYTSLSTSSSNGIGGEYLGNASAYIGMVRANGHFTYLFNNTAVETTKTFYANTDYVIDSTMNNGSQVVKVNDETISTGTISGTFTSTRNIFLYAICSTNDAADVYGSLKIYYLQIYDNGTIVRDFIPAIDENNVPFMFDLVNCKIYENAGTGQFKVGANVEKSGNKNFLRKKLDMFLATLKKKRPYYCELEYLESTGTQYINTGLLSTANSKVDCVFGFTSMESGAANNVGVFGGRNATTTNTFTLFKIASATPQYFRFDYNGQPSAATANQMAWNTTSKYRLEYMGAQIVATNLTTGESVTTTRTPGSTFTSYPIYLFAVNTAGITGQYLSGRIYRYWYTDGTNTIDLIPVLDWDMTPCMYDKVSGQFFYNQGSGTFQYGREIHYVDYLESTGTQYIDTGVKLTNNHSVELDYQLTQASQSRAGLFGALNMTGSNQGRFGSILSPSNSYLEHGYGAGNDYWQQGFPNTGRHKLYQKKNEVYFDGTLVHTFNSATFSLAVNAYLGNFVYTNYTPAKAKYYSSRWWDNDTIVRDYLPAIDENGVGFMFDRVTHTCFLNAGTGAFQYPAREVEYLEGTGTQYIDTGVRGFADFEIGVKLRESVSNVSIFCGNNYRLERYNASNPYWRFRNNNDFYNSGVSITEYHVMAWKNDEIYSDDVKLQDFAKTWNVSANMTLFGISASGSYPSMIYFCKLWNPTDGTIVRDFIPAFKDGQAGMLDKANNVFYLNAGTGTFLTGKVVEPKYES